MCSASELFAHTVGDSYTVEFKHSSTKSISVTVPVANSLPDCHSKPYSYANTASDSNSNPNADSLANSYSNTNSGFNSDTFPDSFTDRHANTKPDSNHNSVGPDTSTREWFQHAHGNTRWFRDDPYRRLECCAIRRC